MNIEAIQELARRWWDEESSKTGYVVIFNGTVAGWKRELDNPQGWEPGCLAVSPEGDIYQAVGGNEYDGAEDWQTVRQRPVCAIYATQHQAEPAQASKPVSTNIANAVNAAAERRASRRAHRLELYVQEVLESRKALLKSEPMSSESDCSVSPYAPASPEATKP